MGIQRNPIVQLTSLGGTLTLTPKNTPQGVSVNLERSDGSSGVGWVKVGAALSYTAFAAAALTNSINLFQLAPAQIIHGIKIQHSVAFAGGALSAYTISVGVAANSVKYASAFNVFQAPGSLVYQLSQNFEGEDTVSPTQILATATSVGANLNAATAGTVTLWALLSVAS